ncbi:kelch-like protein diablo [Patiria miniata]|uniref:BTB domain-containing protein n=1 Tax=Patiria miniata TaxID=46514 RepID=A0A913YZJ2_PATMI|nr:kelch-like protein diablo [Patiria miniata]XP_038044816.1 kelch-like protein diablo [Patiria miniata]XP_038044817.1 kelch-like protein diablo [Patiria miniata]XP_038044818.1 kelch-like protein diablo [Patiria miniata]
MAVNIPEVMEENETPTFIHQDPTWQPNKKARIQDGVISSSETDDTLLMRHRHALGMLAVMQTMHQRRELCDVTLMVQDHPIPAHRLVLAACSPYFNAMFTSELKECNEKTVTLRDMDHVAIQEIVNFAYSAKVNVTEENVQSVLKAACVLQIEQVISLCCEFLKTQMHPSNCLGIKSFAERHGCFELQQAADTFAQQNFCQVVQQDEFLHLSVEDLVDLIRRDALNVPKEEDVYESVMRYLNQNREERCKRVGEIFEHVRLPLLSWEFLHSRVKEDNVVTKDEKCKGFFDEARRYHASQFYPGLHWEVSIRTLPRHSFSRSIYIYVVGGEMNPGRATTGAAERYTPALNCWTSIAPMNSPRRGVGTVMLDKILYAVGGADNTALDAVECFDPPVGAWRYLAPLQEPRSSVAVAASGGNVYAFGGYNGMTSSRTVERYDPNTNEWKYTPDMTSPRSMAAAVAHGTNIYVIGGYDGSSDLSSVECFSPMVKKWRAVSPMHTARSMVAATSFKERIYVAGGCHCSVSLASVEVYNRATDAWILVQPMNHPRSGVGLAAINQRLYALGGYDGSEYLSSVEVYEKEKDEWTVVSNMEAPRRRFGCCS